MEIVQKDINGGGSIFSLLIITIEKAITCLPDVESPLKWPLGKPIPNVYTREVP
jgi:hypothetical protein